MKNIKKLIALILVVFLVSGCTKYSGYTQIWYDDLTKKIDNKDTFVLVFGSATCSACAKYKTTMESVIKDKQVQVFYIDLASLSEENYSKIYSEYVINSTPTTIFIYEGKEKTTYDRIIGAASYNEIVTELQKHGFVGE